MLILDDNMEKEIVKSVVEMSAYVFERGLVSGKAGNVSARFKTESGDIVAITRGQDVVAIARITNDRMPVNQRADLREDFDQMISVSKKVPKDFKLGFWARMLCGVIKLLTPLL